MEDVTAINFTSNLNFDGNCKPPANPKNPSTSSVGNLTSGLGLLTALTSLDLGMNGFEGEIPIALKNLAALEHLVLDRNCLSGSIPAWLGNLVRLETVDLTSREGGQMKGTIPSQLYRLTSLTELKLGSNHFTGTIPAMLGDMTHLKSLVLADCDWGGTIPSNLMNLSLLTKLDLSYSGQLRGTIPEQIGNLVALEYLDLRDTRLSGTIPYGLATLRNLTSLVLSNAQFSGLLPPLPFTQFSRCCIQDSSPTQARDDDDYDDDYNYGLFNNWTCPLPPNADHCTSACIDQHPQCNHGVPTLPDTTDDDDVKIALYCLVAGASVAALILGTQFVQRRIRQRRASTESELHEGLLHGNANWRITFGRPSTMFVQSSGSNSDGSGGSGGGGSSSSTGVYSSATAGAASAWGSVVQAAASTSILKSVPRRQRASPSHCVCPANH